MYSRPTLSFYRLATLTLGALFGIGAEAAAKGWERLPDFPEGNGGMVAVASGEGVRAIGGTNWRGETKVWLDEAIEWQPGDKAWRKVGKLPLPIGYGAAVTRGDKTLLLGGQNSNGPVTELFEVHRDGSVHPVGGWPEAGENVAAVPIKGEWFVLSREAPKPGAPQRGACLAFDPDKRTFRRLADLPNDGWGSAALAAVGGQVLVAGGASRKPGSTDPQNRDEVYRFDPATGAWSLLGRLPVKGRGLAGRALDKDTVYFAGGYVDGPDGAGMFSARAFLVSLSSGRVREAAPLPAAVMGTFVINGGWLYLLGGEDKMRHRTAGAYRIRIAELLEGSGGKP